MKVRNMPSACGRHCRGVYRVRACGLVQTQVLKHCRRKCCHGRPVKGK